MSATHRRSGPSTVKLRCTKAGAGRASRSRVVVTIGLRRLAPCTAGRPHESRHVLAPHVDPLDRGLGMHARRTIGAPQLKMDREDLHRQLRILHGPNGGRALLPRIVPTGRDPEDAAHGGDGDGRPGWLSRTGIPGRDRRGLLGEPGSGFSENLALASRRTRFSRRRRRSSSRSSEVTPSARWPSSRSAWTTQLRMASGRGFELARQLLGRPPRAHELDHPAPKLRWIRWTCSGHLWTPPPPQGNSVHQTGSTPVGGLWRLRGRSAGRAPLRPAPARRLSLGRQTDGSDLDLSAYVDGRHSLRLHPGVVATGRRAVQPVHRLRGPEASVQTK